MVSGTIILIFAVLCLTAQMFFWLVYFRKTGQSKHSPSTYTPPVSVIVCARNEADNLKRYLPLILEQDYPSFELILVDHASVDSTRSVAAELTHKFGHLRYIYCGNAAPSKKPALKTGIDHCQFEHVLVTDADCWPASDQWIKNMVAPFQAGSVMILGTAPLELKTGLLSCFAHLDSALTYLQYRSATLRGRSYMGVGRNMAYLKSLYQSYDGIHDSRFIGGDDDLLVSAFSTSKIALVSDASASMYSQTPPSWTRFYQSKRRHVSVSRQYHATEKLLLATFAGSHWGWLLTTIIMPFWGIPVIVSFTFFISRVLISFNTLRNYAPQFIPGHSRPCILFSDLIYLIHYPLVGLFLLTKPPIKW